MNEKSISERFQRLTPLLLRLGIAAALIMHGTGSFRDGQAAPLGEGALPVVGEDVVTSAANVGTDPPMRVSPQGVDVAMKWPQVAGGAEVAAGVMLALGLLTRLVTLGLLAAVGFALAGPRMDLSQGLLAKLGEALPDASPSVLALLGVASLSLLLTGCGCAGLDRRFFGKRGSQMDLTTP